MVSAERLCLEVPADAGAKIFKRRESRHAVAGEREAADELTVSRFRERVACDPLPCPSNRRGEITVFLRLVGKAGEHFGDSVPVAIAELEHPVVVEIR